jgi:hypothetical protein
MESVMKIALSGSAGTGRTTIAKNVSSHIDFAPITNLAKQILKSEGFRYGTSQTVEEFMATPERQNELFTLKHRAESQYDNFVTDRSWIDLAAYCIQGMQNRQDFDIATFCENCRSEVEKYDAIIHIPWGRQPLQPNGTRTINPWFQFIVDSIICRLANEWKIEMIQIDSGLSNSEVVKEILQTIQCIDPKIEIHEPQKRKPLKTSEES